MLTDIEIAQQAKMLPIHEIATKLGILEEELEERQPRSYYKASGKVREIERDTAKLWKNGKIRIAFIGYENQTEADPDMPLRVIGYDGAEYRVQLTKENDTESRYPVITLILYFGYTKPWDKPKSLLDRLDIPEKLKPYVNDYKINLFEIAYLPLLDKGQHAQKQF